MYKAPLHIYVVWHPSYPHGAKLADQIYSCYSRDISDPLSRGIGIPVFYRSAPYEDDLPRPIKLSEATRTAVILLIDNECVIDWKTYAKQLKDQLDKAGAQHRMIPIAISANAFNIGKPVSNVNFIRLHEVSGKERDKKLFTPLTHELCRLMNGAPRLSEGTGKNYSAAPVKLFISHAKKDGEEIAIKMRDAAQADTAVKTFFDAIDIAQGYDMRNEMAGQVESSALLVVQTDAYASREWCRWEVLRAKKNNRPVIVINAVREGEKRSFPYLGNVPTIRWNYGVRNDRQIRKILELTLMEVLRFYYTYEFISKRPGLSIITKVRKHRILASPPELLTLIRKATEDETKGNVVIYPDPPLTAEELDLLQEVTEDINYLTPTMLAAYQATFKK
ncbi:toll/interleukin-1 receptor domain-containing protein [Owenweeksia hongkongensis]|uniref:toll/interleukin-1 receptor domain-containing protein n=1 Tax=Owenweeksia hongkongensis TaxID=253245 RepID=UPI003A93A533